MARISKETAKEEIRRCGQDPVYFLKNYVRISHPLEGLIPFTTYDFQDKLLDEFKNHRFNIILKARQLGISTIVAGYAAWMLLFRREKQVLVVATKFKTAANLVIKVKKMLKTLPEWMMIADIKVDNQSSFELSNGSKINASTTSAKDAGRSESLSLLIVDEAAFVEGMEELWTGILPTITTGGRCVALSCVTKDTFVFTNEGIKTVEDFIPNEGKAGDYEIPKYTILGKNGCRSSNLFHNNGIVNTRKIYTTNSYLEGSENHKLWAYRLGKYDWVKMEDLQEGDFVGVQYGKNLWGNNDDTSDFYPKITSNHKNIFKPSKITPEIAYILGMYLAEGSVYEVKNKTGDLIGGTTTFTCGDDLTTILETCGLPVSKSDNFHHCCSSKTFIEFLKYLGFAVNNKAPQKTIPSRLLQMSRENVKYLLRGLFDGDGYSRADKGEIGIGLSSLRMIEQVRILLNNFGILTEYSQVETPPTEKVKISSIQHRLSLNKEESKKFYDIIGFGFERKQKNNVVLKEHNLERANPKDVIPGFLHHMKNMFEYYPKGSWTLNKKFGLNINGILNKQNEYKTENISRQNALKMYEATKEYLPEWYKEEIQKILSIDLKWQPIIKIETGRKETFDFSLPETDDFWCHSVIYNGILGHQTPNGVGNWFYKTYTDAEAGKNLFNPVTLPWDVHPDRDEQWFLEQTKNMSKREVAQEFECSFNMSGETVVSPDDMMFLKQAAKDPEHRTGFDRNYWIWETPQQGVGYLVSADVSRGDGADNSVFHVFRVDTFEQVAEYQGKPNHDMFAMMLNSVGKEYGNALMVVENNNVGFNVLDKLITLEYPNLYYSTKGTHEFVDHYAAEYTDSIVSGFSTTTKTRPLIIAKMEEFVRNKIIKINSPRTIREFETFVWNNGKPEAMRGYNDDLVMSLAIACWVKDIALTTNKRETAYMNAILGAMKKSDTNINTSIPGMIGYKKNQDIFSQKQNQAAQQMKDFLWIYKG